MAYTKTKDADLVRAFGVRCQKGVFEYSQHNMFWLRYKKKILDVCCITNPKCFISNQIIKVCVNP